MSARASATGTITFGLVSIPIKVYTAASPERVGFNMLHRKCGGRVKQLFECPTDGNERVERDALVHGYEHARDQYVTFTDEELKKLEAAEVNGLDLTEFVPMASVPLEHLEKTYYLGPDKGGERAYRVLVEAMRASKLVAVGRQMARGRDQLALVRPHEKAAGLVLHHVFYAPEVRAFSDVPMGADVEVTSKEVALARKLLADMKMPAFDASRFSDEYLSRVRAAVDEKVAGREIVVAKAPAKGAHIVDLSEALEKSLAKTRGPAKAGARKHVAA